MRMNGWILLVAWCWLCAYALDLHAAGKPASPAGASYIIDKWDTEDNLPENAVIAMTQTRDGYLWLGTFGGGLVRFDGINFKVFDEGNTPRLNSSRIVSLFQDSRSNLWIGTENAGVALMKDGQISRPFDAEPGLFPTRLLTACEEPSGAIWLSFANGQIARYADGQYTAYTNFLHAPYAPSLYHGLIAEHSGGIWVGTDHRQTPVGAGRPADVPEWLFGRLDFLLASRGEGYWRLADGHVQHWTTTPTNQLDRDWLYAWATDAHISCACEDRQGNLLVGTLGAGLYWFNGDGEAASPLFNRYISGVYNSLLPLDAKQPIQKLSCWAAGGVALF
jgi:hypothetical protein